MMIHDGLKRAAELHARGDLSGARREIEAVLAAQPRSATALQFAGVLCCQSGDTKRGADFLRRSLKLDPQDVNTRLNLARALIELREYKEAERCCAQPAASPASPELRRMHAETLKAQGRLGEAASVYEQLVEAQPNDFQSWNNLGNVRGQVGDIQGAIAALEEARALRPEELTVHLNLANVRAVTGGNEAFIASLGEAVQRSPKNPGLLLELGKALSRADRHADALLPLGDSARLDQRNPETFWAIGQAFAVLEKPQQAEQAFRFALQIGPNYAPAYLDYGLLLEKQNRLDDLEKLVAQAAARGIGSGEIDYLRAVLLRRNGRLDEALALAGQAESAALDTATRSYFIGQVADQLGYADTAFGAFEDMNRALVEAQAAPRFDGTEYLWKVQRLTEVTTKAWLGEWQRAPVPAAPPSPAFLVGFPRSGTTLMDTILMGHAYTHVLEELPILATLADELGDTSRIPELGEQEIARLRGRYFEELNKLSQPAAGKIVIDKNPLLMLRAPLIHRLFPDARIVFALRHPCDVVLSCFMQNFKVTEAMAAFTDMRNAALLYDGMMRFWERASEVFPLDVHTIRYEDLIADVESEARPLLDFLGLPWDERILDHQKTAKARGYIRTPSHAQVTEKIYTRAQGRWERYRDHMREALPILAPWVERFGYEPIEKSLARSQPVTE